MTEGICASPPPPATLPVGVTFELSAPLGTELEIRRYRLANGLGVITVVDSRVPIVAYQTWYRVGSRDETQGRTGMAHLFEHLMFNQTETLRPGEFDRLVEGTGGDSNAATWVDWTYYRLSLPARDLELAVRLESERMHRLVLGDEELATEREVVINERLESVEDDVDGLLDETLFKTAFDESPYRWPTIGWMEDIRAITRPDIETFYRTHYAPDNATIIVVGDIDESNLLSLLAGHYGKLKAANRPPRTAPKEPAQVRPRCATFDKPVSADRVVLGYRAPGQLDEDWAALELLGTVLSGGPAARLYRRLVIETEMATGVQAGINPFRDENLFRVAVSAQKGHSAEQILELVREELDKVRGEGISEPELARAKNIVTTDFWMSLGDVDGKAEALGHYESTLGDFRALFGVRDRIDALTPEDIQRVAIRYLDDRQSTTVICRPSAEEVPE